MIVVYSLACCVQFGHVSLARKFCLKSKLSTGHRTGDWVQLSWQVRRYCYMEPRQAHSAPYLSCFNWNAKACAPASCNLPSPHCSSLNKTTLKENHSHVFTFNHVSLSDISSSSSSSLSSFLQSSPSSIVTVDAAPANEGQMKWNLKEQGPLTLAKVNRIVKQSNRHKSWPLEVLHFKHNNYSTDHQKKKEGKKANGKVYHGQLKQWLLNVVNVTN